MIFTTINQIPGVEVSSTLGLVTGVSVQASRFGTDFTSAIRGKVGGSMGSYESTVQNAQQQAMQKLAQNAQQMGANAVVGVKFQLSSMGTNDAGGMIVCQAFGTAIVYKN